MATAATPHSTPPIGHGSQNIAPSAALDPTADQSPRNAAGVKNSRHKPVAVAISIMMPHTAPVSLA